MEQSGKPELIGRTLAHYQIRSAIGAGGMGEVYRATDTRLERDVALKVLPGNMAADPERFARFQREARAVAALNHPNVVTVFSVEQSDGVHFITMELIEGHTLDRLISAEGLPAERIVEIAGEIAEALAAAHDKGIVHRDLKPANVMVTNEGRVKVLDFGLAKDVVKANTESEVTRTSPGLTQAGVVMGTPSYMSPEQVSGRPLDHRSDLYSLGVVMFEMSTGRRPFEGVSSAELISAILRDTPPAVTDTRPELPGDLARVIRRCLEKDPRHRMQTARDISNEFRDLARSVLHTPTSTVVAAAPIAPGPSGAIKPGSGAASTEEGFWVAVLPFKYSGTSEDLKAFAEGLTDEIVTGLSRFSYLRVVARGSTARFAGEVVDVRAAGQQLNARYVMEGTLRQAGAKLRLAVQLVDTVTGTHLWAENYERAFSADAVFELQDDLVPRIASTVADWYGVLTRSISETLRNKSEDSLTPHEAVLRGFSYFARLTADEHATARRILERVVRENPDQGDCWAMLAMMYNVEYSDEYNVLPNTLERALSAAQRAIDLAPSHSIGHYAVAWVYFFLKDKPAFHAAMERAIALNPMDGYAIGMLGLLLLHTGERERGMEMTETAMKLNPNSSGALKFTPFTYFYMKGKYKEALDAAVRINMPGFFYAQASLAEALGQLGDREAAQKAVKDLLALRPDFAATARRNYAKWYEPEDVEHFLDGLRKAGLDIPGENRATPGSGSSHISSTTSSAGTARAEDGFWVAVLPFKCSSGASGDLKALSEGLTDEIIAGLSRFSYLRVIARGSTARYAEQAVDVRTAGKELNARYVMEGTLRQAGSKLRLAVQLVDTVTGVHLWAENYERAFGADAVFELQDDLVPRVVSSLADSNGALTRSISETLRAKNEDSLTPHEAVLRGFSYFARLTAEEHATVRRILERVVRESPDQADPWAMLSMMYNVEYSDNYNALPDPLGRAQAAAQRAVDLAPSNALGHYSLAWVYFFRRDKAALLAAVERTLALNPMDGSKIGMLGLLLHHAGERERGLQMTEMSIKLNPNYSGAVRFTSFSDFYLQGKYKEALDAAVRINMPGFFFAQAALAAAFGQLGDRDGAEKAVSDLLALRPDFATTARREYGKWYGTEDVEHLVDGLRKAGLDIPDHAATNTLTSGASRSNSGTGSGASRADEGFWVAVLPFKHNGRNADVTALADGLGDEIITGLHKFSFLRVISRSSTSSYANENVDVRAAAKELGARYVLEGSLHQAGSKVRIAIRLVDALNGAGLWAETYDRVLAPEALLDLLDELVPRIVSTVGDTQGVLVHNMTETLRHRDPETLTPYEAVVRSLAYHQYVNAEEHRAGLIGLERALKQPPVSADCWAMLSWLYRGEFTYGFNARPDPLGRALAAAQRAVAADPSNAMGHAALASVLFCQRDYAAFRTAVRRAVSSNRTEGYALAYLGILLAFSGDWDEGCDLAERATQLNPNHPSWYWMPLALRAYRKGDGQRALDYALRGHVPGLWLVQMILAVVYVQVGQMEQARNAVREMLVLRPNFRVASAEELGKWFQPEMIERLMLDLRKGGLEIPNSVGTVPSQ